MGPITANMYIAVSDLWGRDTRSYYRDDLGEVRSGAGAFRRLGSLRSCLILAWVASHKSAQAQLTCSSNGFSATWGSAHTLVILWHTDHEVSSNH